MTANARMTDDERRKVFWLLKKYSSYTAWEALALAYYRFTDAYMLAHKVFIPDPSVPDRASTDEWHAGHLKEILDGRIGFEKGLPRLKAGDRSVWRRSRERGISRSGRERSFAAWGPLARGIYKVDFIRRILDPEEYGLDWMNNKDDVIAKKDALLFWSARIGAVMERVEAKHPAPMSPYDALQTVHPQYGYAMNNPAYLNFPVSIPNVPEPTATTFETGNEVFFDGVYEPEWGSMQDPSSPGLLGKLKIALTDKPSLVDSEPLAPVVSSRREHIGCMNYLLANTTAPLYQNAELDKPMPVTWRLVWKDERYLDGVISPEEAEYIAPVAAPGADTTQLRCDADQRCPREGWWFSPAKSDSRRHFAQDEVMPAFSTNYGATIWQWDEQQS